MVVFVHALQFWAVQGGPMQFSLVQIGTGWAGWFVASTDPNSIFMPVSTWCGSVHPEAGMIWQTLVQTMANYGVPSGFNT